MVAIVAQQKQVRCLLSTSVMRTSSVRFAICVGTLGLLAGCRSSGAAATPEPEGSGATASGATAAPSASASAKADSFPIPRASVDYVLNPEGLPAYSGPTGSVEGTITVSGPAAPDVKVDVTKCPAALDAYGKLFREGTPEKPGGSRWLADAAVVAVGYTGFYVAEKSDALRVTISPACAYATRTIAMTYGQRLEVANQSKLLFAPLIDQATTPAVMVAPPLESGDPVKIYPQKAGYFTLVDRMEPFVREDLYVFRHPLHAVSDTSGHYRIDGLPVGKLEVGVHHPAIDADAKAPVEVVAGLVQRVDLALTYKPKPAAKVDGGLPPKRLQND
jgi:hypothetical protein